MIHKQETSEPQIHTRNDISPKYFITALLSTPPSCYSGFTPGHSMHHDKNLDIKGMEREWKDKTPLNRNPLEHTPK